MENTSRKKQVCNLLKSVTFIMWLLVTMYLWYAFFNAIPIVIIPLIILILGPMLITLSSDYKTRKVGWCILCALSVVTSLFLVYACMMLTATTEGWVIVFSFSVCFIILNYVLFKNDVYEKRT